MVVREGLYLVVLVVNGKTYSTLTATDSNLEVLQSVNVLAGNRRSVEVVGVETYFGILACTSLGVPEAATGLTIVAIGRSVSTVVNEEYLVVYGIVLRFYLRNGLVDFLLCGIVL